MTDLPQNPEGIIISSDEKTAAQGAVLTEAVRHVDIVHISLTGMTAIVLMLLAALALPVFGHNPVTDPVAFWVMAFASFIGIAGLYLLNFRVHQHVTNQARLTEVLVNSLGQGFVVFGIDGICENVYSQACFDLLEIVPAGKPIPEVLGIEKDKRGDFMEWLEILYQKDHALSFDDVVRFFPQFYPHSKGRRISLMYRPILGKQDVLTKIVVIATDLTEEYAAREAAKKQQNYAEMICHIFRDRNQFQTTLAHVRDFLELAQKPEISMRNAPELLRQLHTLKASVKQYNLIEFGEVIHEAENALRDSKIKTDAAFLRELKAGCARIEECMDYVRGEICSQIGAECEWHGHIREIDEEELYAFARELQSKGVEAAVIEDYLAHIVAVPLKECFRNFERELQELAGPMEKQLKPVIYEGENPPVLTQPMQEFLFSLTHISRNIIDHGIELPVTRMARGKDAAGQVIIAFHLVAAEEGEKNLLIKISDDGNGIDPSRVRAKLSTLDPEGDWRTEDDQTLIQRIFSWGFTTKEHVSMLSGRGVGTEAVDEEVRKLGGSIKVSSELYKGTSFEILLPYHMKLPA